MILHNLKFPLVAIPVSGKTSHQTDSVAAAVFGSDNNTATARPSTKLNSFHVGGKTQISLTHEEGRHKLLKQHARY
jgi:hypothetical protein